MKLLRILLPILVLGIGLAIGWGMVKTAPKAEKRSPPPVVPLVEVMPLQTRDFTVTVSSYGVVEPSTQTTLVAEVSGKITKISPQFSDGAYLNQGELLLEIDARDYRDAVTIAEAQLQQAQTALQQEVAQGEQARLDWQQLGNGAIATELVLRKPQRASAEAAVASARAQLQQAKTRLERTRITAPYDGRLLQTQVDIGQYVAPGTALASVYATDYAEVKLPLTDRQASFLALPEHYRGETPQPGPVVTLSKDGTQWQGRIVRTAGAIDSTSQQQVVIAKVDNPYQRQQTGQPPLKIGTFVNADITGDTLREVFVVPRSALRENRIVLLAQDGQIRRVEIAPLWSDDSQVIVRDGLRPGDQLIVSPVAYAAEGARIETRQADTAGKP